MALIRRLSIDQLVVLMVAVLLAASVAVVLVGSGRPQDRTWAKIQHDKRLIVAIDPSYPPFAIYGDPVPVGLDADLAQALAEALGVEVFFSWQGYDGLYDTLILGHADIIISALRPDPLRTEQVYYTSPYVDAGQVLVLRGDSDFSSIDEVTFDALAGKTLTVEFATEGDIAARRYLANAPSAQQFTLQQLVSSAEALQAVIDGVADGAIVDRISAGEFSRVHPDAGLVISAPLVADPIVIAIREKDWRVIEEIEKALSALRHSGQLEMMVNRWLGVEDTQEDQRDDLKMPFIFALYHSVQSALTT